MAKAFGPAWTKATKKLVNAADKKLPRIEATLDLSRAFEMTLTQGSRDYFGGIVDPLKSKVDEATRDIAAPLTEALNRAMAASWGWSEGARDIIDTGELRDSLEITTMNGDVQIAYSAPYAGLVHYGGYISPYGNANIERVYLPGRPWVTATLEGNGPVPQFDFDDYYSRYL
jgi:phage gpG-like protein